MPLLSLKSNAAIYRQSQLTNSLMELYYRQWMARELQPRNIFYRDAVANFIGSMEQMGAIFVHIWPQVIPAHRRSGSCTDTPPNTYTWWSQECTKKTGKEQSAASGWNTWGVTKVRVYEDGGQPSCTDKLYAQRLVQKCRCPISKKDDKLTCENYIVVVYMSVIERRIEDFYKISTTTKEDYFNMENQWLVGYSQ